MFFKDDWFLKVILSMQPPTPHHHQYTTVYKHPNHSLLLLHFQGLQPHINSILMSNICKDEYNYSIPKSICYILINSTVLSIFLIQEKKFHWLK